MNVHRSIFLLLLLCIIALFSACVCTPAAASVDSAAAENAADELLSTQPSQQHIDSAAQSHGFQQYGDEDDADHQLLHDDASLHTDDDAHPPSSASLSTKEQEQLLASIYAPTADR